MQHLFLLLLHLLASSPSLLLITDTPLFAACQPNNNSHSQGAGIYAMSVILKGRHAHPCFSPPVSFLESRTGRPRTVSLYRELLLRDTRTLFTPRGENECLSVIQQPPQFVLALTRGACQPQWHPAHASRWSETSTAVPSDSLRGVVLVTGSFWSRRPAMHVTAVRRDMSRHTCTHTNKMNWPIPPSGSKLSFWNRNLHIVAVEVFFSRWPGYSDHKNQNCFTVSVILLRAYKGRVSWLLFCQSPVLPRSINFCAPWQMGFFKQLLRNKTKLPGDEWGKEAVVSGWRLGVFWVGTVRADGLNVCICMTPHLSIHTQTHTHRHAQLTKWKHATDCISPLACGNE